jgi:hypothetical protein
LCMRRIEFLCSALILLSLIVGGASHCAGSENPRLVVRDGKRLMCTVRFIDTMSGDCGTGSYDEVFTAKVLAIEQVPGSRVRHFDEVFGATYPSDVRLTVEPEEVLKGNPPHC